MQVPRPFVLAVLLAAAAAAPVRAGPDPEVLALVRGLFVTLQPKSFAAGREYCGFIGRRGDGALVASPPVQGAPASCAPELPDGAEVVASYHTHGRFEIDDWGEVPSDIDLEGDIAMGVDGFIATPGGRLWHIDHRARTARQLCGIGCLPRDPRFRIVGPPKIAEEYSQRALADLLGR